MKKLIIFVLALFLTSCALIDDYSKPHQESFTETEKGINAFDTANYQAALDYLIAPAEKGDADAQYIVGMIYLYGLAGTKNSYTAQKWLTLAAEEGHRAAQEQLAFLYDNELAPLYNPVNAYHWFSIIIGDFPQYRGKLQNLEWALRSRGLLSAAQTMPLPREKQYKGVNFNYLFPLR